RDPPVALAQTACGYLAEHAATAARGLGHQWHDCRHERCGQPDHLRRLGTGVRRGRAQLSADTTGRSDRGCRGPARRGRPAAYGVSLGPGPAHVLRSTWTLVAADETGHARCTAPLRLRPAGTPVLRTHVQPLRRTTWPQVGRRTVPFRNR